MNLKTFFTHYCSTGATLGYHSVKMCKKNIFFVADFGFNYIILYAMNLAALGINIINLLKLNICRFIYE